MAWIIRSLLCLRRNQSKQKLAATSLYKHILSLLSSLSLSPPLPSSLSHTIITHNCFNLLIVRDHNHHFTIRALEIQGSKMKALCEYQPIMAGRLTGRTEQCINPSVCPLSSFYSSGGQSHGSPRSHLSPAPYACPFFNENHVQVHLCLSHPVYFETYHTCDLAVSLAVSNFLF